MRLSRSHVRIHVHSPTLSGTTLVYISWRRNTLCLAIAKLKFCAVHVFDDLRCRGTP
jgi:hypothetical protein